MPKVLKATFPERCIGCEMCVLEAQRQLKKIGLEGSLIRVLRSTNTKLGYIEYNLDIDPRISNLNIDKIKNICPQAVFEIEETQ